MVPAARAMTVKSLGIIINMAMYTLFDPRYLMGVRTLPLSDVSLLEYLPLYRDLGQDMSTPKCRHVVHVLAAKQNRIALSWIKS